MNWCKKTPISCGIIEMVRKVVERRAPGYFIGVASRSNLEFIRSRKEAGISHSNDGEHLKQGIRK